MNAKAGIFFVRAVHGQTYHFEFTFNNRFLRFMPTPYAHSQGSFVTYDEKIRTLFTSDFFGSFSTQWDLFLRLKEACYTCNDDRNCPNGKTYCPLPDLIEFTKASCPAKRRSGMRSKRSKSWIWI
jgi:hypothetical protein